MELEPEQIFQQFKEVVNGTRKSDSPSSLHSLISRVTKGGSGRDFVAYNFFRSNEITLHNRELFVSRKLNLASAEISFISNVRKLFELPYA